MRPVIVALLCLAGCANQSWTLPQPHFRTTQPEGAWGRAIKATEAHCNGLELVNDEASVIVGQWTAWNTGDGLVLTQCLVTLLRGDEYVRDVRVTFAARRCPLSDQDTELAVLAKRCEPSDTVPEQVKNGLVEVGRKLEADLNAVR